MAIFDSFPGVFSFIRHFGRFSSSLILPTLVVLLGGCGHPTGAEIVREARDSYSRLHAYRERAQLIFLQSGPDVLTSDVGWRRGSARAAVRFSTGQYLLIYRLPTALYLVSPFRRAVEEAGPGRLPVEAGSLGSFLREIPPGARLTYAGRLLWRGRDLRRVLVRAPDFRAEVDFDRRDRLPRQLLVYDEAGEPVLRETVLDLDLRPRFPAGYFRFRLPKGYSLRSKPLTAAWERG